MSPMQLATPEISHEIEGAVQIPHPLEGTDNQIPSCPGRQRCQMPGVCPGGGGVLKLRFDLYIMLNMDKFHNRQDLKQADVNIKNQKIL